MRATGRHFPVESEQPRRNFPTPLNLAARQKLLELLFSVLMIFRASKQFEMEVGLTLCLARRARAAARWCLRGSRLLFFPPAQVGTLMTVACLLVFTLITNLVFVIASAFLSNFVPTLVRITGCSQGVFTFAITLMVRSHNSASQLVPVQMWQGAQSRCRCGREPSPGADVHGCT